MEIKQFIQSHTGNMWLTLHLLSASLVVQLQQQFSAEKMRAALKPYI